MSHKFQRGAESYACGMLDLMLQRMEDHQREHNKALPVKFILHPGTSKMLNDEHYKRFGEPHNMQFAGIPIMLCQCQNVGHPLPIDLMLTADGRAEIL
jgi:hypothetical protein